MEEMIAALCLKYETASKLVFDCALFLLHPPALF